jgi:hypothetical protein
MGLRTYLGGRHTTPFKEKGEKKKKQRIIWRGVEAQLVNLMFNQYLLIRLNQIMIKQST